MQQFEEAPQQLPESETNISRRPTAKTITYIALTAALSTGIVGELLYIDHELPGNGHSTHSSSVMGTGGAKAGISTRSSTHSGSVTKMCPAARPTDISAVTKLFDTPQPIPHVTQSMFHKNKNGTYNNPYKKFYDKRQRALGIVTHDYFGFMDKHDPTYEHPRDPFERHLKITNQFAAQYGVTITVATPTVLKTLGIAGASPTAKDERAITYANNLDAIGDALSSMPVQFVRKDIGLRHIIITKSVPYLGRALTEGADDTIILNGEAANFPAVVEHEAFHLEDTRLCGSSDGAANDPGFDALNHGVPYTTKSKIDEQFLKTVPGSKQTLIGSDSYENLNDKLSNDSFHNKLKSACSDLRKKLKMLAPAVMLSDYGYTSVVEDKADLGKNMTYPIGYEYALDKDTPLVRAKFLYLIARVLRQDPNVVRFYALKAQRPSDNPAPNGVHC